MIIAYVILHVLLHMHVQVHPSNKFLSQNNKDVIIAVVLVLTFTYIYVLIKQRILSDFCGYINTIMSVCT